MKPTDVRKIILANRGELAKLARVCGVTLAHASSVLRGRTRSEYVMTALRRRAEELTRPEVQNQ